MRRFLIGLFTFVLHTIPRWKYEYREMMEFRFDKSVLDRYKNQ